MLGLFDVGKAEVLKLWVATPLGLKKLFKRVAKDYGETQVFTLQFITVAKLQLGSSNKNNVMVGVSPQ